MKTKTSSSGKWAGAGIFAAIAASLCCITPVLALLAGTSGLAAGFSWMGPLRPYLIGLTVAVLGFAWYQKLKPQKTDEIDCDCEEEGKVPFLQTKYFLGMVSLFAIAMLAFPNYASAFYTDNSKEVIVENQEDIQIAYFDIKGMTCNSCEEHIKYAVNELEGIIETNASFTNGKAAVKYDGTRVTLEEIRIAINSTGYKVVGDQLKRK